MAAHTATAHLIDIADLRACVDVAGIVALFQKLRYPVESPPVAVPLAPDDLPGMLRDEVVARYVVADVGDVRASLGVTLFVLRTAQEKSSTIRGIAQQWTRRFAGEHLLVFAAQPTDDHGFAQITFVNTRRLGEGAQVRIKLHKLIVDRLNPTRHDAETLNAIAAPAGAAPEARALYAAQCDAFDVERITNAFYREYAKRFQAVKARIQHDNPAIAALHDDERLHTFTQRLFGRVMFLYFLQKKGALNGEAAFLQKWYKNALAEHENFYRYVLEPLFFQTLNAPRPDARSPLFGHVPYLNGGLFAEDADDHRGSVYLDNAIFDAKSMDGLLYFLDTHNFTIEEDTPLEVEVALDPEMLGKVFENLLAEAERSQSGTFYTPRAVVAFMCREALAAYLERATGLDAPRLGWLLDEAETGEPARDDAQHERLTAQTLPRALREQIERALENVRVLDPAVGSGAFPLGMLALLIGVRRALYRVAGATVAPHSHLVEGWKRNFIRDCLYGVDIKREAIEIARLRLWLSLVVDANPFEMEPLPNLDYKLMDGNSLIETFDGVAIYPTRPPAGQVQSRFGNEATEDLQARLHTLQDAYFQPDPAGSTNRQELKEQIRATEYAIVATELHQKDADNTTRLNHLLQQLHMVLGKQSERTIRAEVQALQHAISTTKAALADLKAGKTLPFFLFRLHFASVFAERDGFDIVIANPPYVRHEKIGPDVQSALKASYPQVQHGMADLYTYFYARGLDLLHAGGTLAYITSNKFFRAGYGAKLRELLQSQTHLRAIIDFGDAPVFDAAAYPCIVVTGKGAPPADYTYPAFTAANDIDLDKLGAIFHAQAQHLAQADGARPPASTGATSALVAKLLRMGTPLGTYVDGKMYRGVVTGLNEAFVIDQATRDRLISEDPKIAEVLKPFLRGRDIGRYAIHPAGLWLIFTRQGTDISRYPAIEKHLAQWRTQLEPKPKGWNDADLWPGRKSGPYKWFEIQDTVEYHPAFQQIKVVFPDIASYPEFAYDMSKSHLGNTSYAIPTSHKYLCAWLNSKVIEFIYSSLSPQVRGGYYRFIYQYMIQLPIVEPSPGEQQRLGELVDALQVIGGQGPEAEAMEREVDAIVYRTYGLTAAEIAEIERWHAERRATLGVGKGRRGKEGTKAGQA
jgi:adenine-specific DNA-methyltransferase